MAARLRRGIIVMHRWLGIALGLLFAAWFASGVVLYYVPYPKLTPEERLGAMAPIDWRGCCVAPAVALQAMGLDQVSGLRLGMLEGRPVYRARAAHFHDGAVHGSGPWRVAYADSGELLGPADAARAAAIASRHAGGVAVRSVSAVDLDQWTVGPGLRGYEPFFAVELDDAGATRLYVSVPALEVVRDATYAERAWNWVGAVTHWVYPTELRRRPDLWHWTVVVLSVFGVFLAATGTYLGILFLNTRARRMARLVPYREPWMRWHHWTGLVGAVLTVTWMVSGLLSMNPLKVFPSTGATPGEQHRWTGGALDRANASAIPAGAAGGLHGVREVEWQRFGGQTWQLARIDAGRTLQVLPGGLRTATPAGELGHALAGIRPGIALLDVDLLDHHDDYYYLRNPGNADRPLPVARARFQDGVVLYADPSTARLLLRVDDAQRVRRWAYNGLHSLDFAWLRERPLLQASLIVGGCLLGFMLSITGVVIGWRYLRSGQGQGVSA